MRSAFELMQAAEAFRPGLLRLTYVLTGVRQDAEDVVQESLVRLHAHARSDNSLVIEDLGRYLRRVVLNEVRDRQRRAARRGEVLVDAVPERPSTRERADDHHAVVALVRQLPERQRAAVVLRYLEDRPDTEIADILGCSRLAVRLLVKRGLDRLRATTTSADALELLR